MLDAGYWILERKGWHPSERIKKIKLLTIVFLIVAATYLTTNAKADDPPPPTRPW